MSDKRKSAAPINTKARLVVPGNKAELDHDEIAALAAMPDDQIDLTDMPEKTDWSHAKRGMMFRPIKTQLTLRLDADLIAWFRAHPRGRGYQTRINQALREYMNAHDK
ncbi:MAG: BrnA antitoxin family protein [Azospirillaceae bacterium]|nr:BrnA antitoxin family protein [Azospirillaceae bacterium]